MDPDMLILCIEDLRKVIGKTKEEMATEIGVSLRTYYRWLKAEAVPSPLACRRMLELLDRYPINTTFYRY
jgi:DNA-binding XRE family transcriptional regulator